MTKLSYAQVRAYAAAAGAPDPDTAAAIAMAESGGNTNSHNPIPPDDSYGLWQINMYGSMGPSRRKSLGISSNTQLYDPAVNARAMMMISSGGTNFKPWTTYSTGIYKSYLQGKSGGTTAVPIDSTTATNAGLLDVPGQIVKDVTGTAGVVIDAANWIVNPSNWLRVVYVVAGAGVVLVGIDLLVRNQILGSVAKSLGGDSGGSTAKSVGVIGKKVFSPGGKAKAATTVATKGA